MSPRKPPVLDHAAYTYLAATLSSNSPFYPSNSEDSQSQTEPENGYRHITIPLAIADTPSSSTTITLDNLGPVGALPDTVLLGVQKAQWEDSRIQDQIMKAFKTDKRLGVVRVDVQVPQVRSKRKGKDEL